MDKTSRRVIITIVVIVLIACLCLSIAAISGAFAFILRPSRTVISGPENVLTPIEATVEQHATKTPLSVETQLATPGTSQGEATPDASRPPVATLPAAITSQMDQIQQQVVSLRGLQPSKPVERALLTTDQLRKRVTDDFLKDYTAQDAKDDALILSTFGLLNPDFDLYDFYINLYSEQIAGFYDDKTKEMYVIQGEGFTGYEKLTYSHEYDHVLQDQNYDMENGLKYNDEQCKKETERCAAIQSLLEGDATVLEMEWFSQYATQKDLADVQKFYNNYQSPVYDSAPPFMKEDFIFPYTYGQTFVQSLHDSGGWEAVDQAYKNLPVSTEQILHPERYPNDKPVPVDLPDLTKLLGSGWREIDRNEMGEWYTYLTLAKGLDPQTMIDDNQAKNAAKGWGGDEYIVYSNDQSQQLVMVLKTVWDTEKDASEFADAFETYATSRFGQSTDKTSTQETWQDAHWYSSFQINGSTTTWVLTPDQATNQAVLEAVK